MEDIVAIKAVEKSGKEHFFLTWGRIFDPVDEEALLAAVRVNLPRERSAPRVSAPWEVLAAPGEPGVGGQRQSTGRDRTTVPPRQKGQCRAKTTENGRCRASTYSATAIADISTRS